MNIYNYLGDPLSGDIKWKVCGIEATAHNDVIILHALYKAAKGWRKLTRTYIRPTTRVSSNIQ